MKSYLIPILSGIILMFLSRDAAAQQTDSTIIIKVEGACNLCKTRIEEAAKGKGVRSAKWSPITKNLVLTYDATKTSPAKVQQRIANVGHDTEVKKAEDNEYKALPDWCLHRNGAHNDDEEAGHEHDSHDAEASTFSGAVLYQSNGRQLPLAGASIVWLGSSTGTTSGEDGNFQMKRNSHTNKMVISFTGYHNDTLDVAGFNHLGVVLQPSSQLKGVTVTTNRSSLSVNTTSAIRSYNITSKELTKAACCNLSESFETNPSVDVTYNDAVTGSRQIQMLGLAGNYSQLTVENLPGPRGLATPLGLNSIPGTCENVI